MSGEIMLLTVCSRLVGLTSVVHMLCRDPSGVGAKQAERVAEIIYEVDGDIGVILSPQQRNILDKLNIHRPRIVALQGGPAQF